MWQESVRGVRIALPPLSERASQRRSLDERLYVRFPGFLARLGQTWMRLPPTSRFRRLMLTRLIQCVIHGNPRRKVADHGSGAFRFAMRVLGPSNTPRNTPLHTREVGGSKPPAPTTTRVGWPAIAPDVLPRRLTGPRTREIVVP
jgi:hypothetical protein